MPTPNKEKDPFDYIVQKTLLEADQKEMKTRQSRLQKLNALCQQRTSQHNFLKLHSRDNSQPPLLTKPIANIQKDFLDI